MAFENPVKQRLARGGTAWGAGSVIADPLAVQLTADSGVDFVWMDTEHMPYGTEALALMPTICRRQGAVPLIRVATLDPALIKKALDIGAQAIMIPQVDNAEMARAAVQYAKYPPMGNRGVSPMFTFYNGFTWDEYLPHANAESLIIVQVETEAGAKNVEEIAAVDGVDVVLAGPMDLSASFGVIGQTGHAKVQDFLAAFPARVTKFGKTAGIALGSVEAAAKAHGQGYRLINFGNILWSGLNGLKAGLAELHKLEGR